VFPLRSPSSAPSNSILSRPILSDAVIINLTSFSCVSPAEVNKDIFPDEMTLFVSASLVTTEVIVGLTASV